MTGALGLAGGCTVAALWLGPSGDGTRRLDRLHMVGRSRPRGRRVAHLAASRVLSGRRPWTRRGSADDEQVVELLTAFAAELRAGAAPAVALARCAAEVCDPQLASELAPAVEMVRLGAPGSTALRHAAIRCRPQLTWLAAGWQLTETQGTPLAPVATRVALAAREQLRHRSAVRAELAGPRLSARMLALLPAFGLGLGTVLGADPLRVLVATPAGLACLVGAVLLEIAGLRWTASLVRRAEEAG